MNKKLFLSLLLISLIALPALAAIPDYIHIQGIISPRPDEGKQVKLRLYDQESGGSTVGNVLDWPVVHGSTSQSGKIVIDESGFFNVAFNTGPTATYKVPYYLQVEVDGNVLQPRQPLYPAPYAMTAKNVYGGTGDFIGNVAIGKEESDAYIKLTSDELKDATEAYIWSEDTVGFAVGSSAGDPDLVVNAAGKVGIGTSSPTASLEVAGELKLKPVQVASVPNPTPGTMICNSDNNRMMYHDGSQWIQIDPAFTTKSCDMTSPKDTAFKAGNTDFTWVITNQDDFIVTGVSGMIIRSPNTDGMYKIVVSNQQNSTSVEFRVIVSNDDHTNPFFYTLPIPVKFPSGNIYVTIIPDDGQLYRLEKISLQYIKLPL